MATSKVIVTVMRRGDQRAWDVELPTDVPARKLVEMIVQAMGWGTAPPGNQTSYRVIIRPAERALLPHESLADAAVWDGAWLVLT